MLSNTDPRLESLVKQGHKLTPATLAYKRTQGLWLPAKHLLYLSNQIAAAVQKGGARIVVEMPFRHGKSEFISVNTPIWFLDKYPNKNVILASYGADLSTDFSRKVRDSILEEPPELDVRLDSGSLQVGRFHTTGKGAMFACGIGGAITGRGADLLIIDDYIKNAEDSFSETIRNKTWEWFLSVAFTRLEPGAGVIVLATRWHQDDLIGRILKEQPGKWTEIKLPALALENDPLGRAIGEPLWPERYDLDALMEIKDTLGTYWWEAMCQQNPLATMNGVVSGDMLVEVSELPHHSRMKWIRAWDFASSDNSKGDFSAGPRIGRDKDSGRFYITDLPHFQKSPAQTEKMVRETAEQDGTKIPIWLEQEPGSAGKIVVDHYSDDVLKEFSVKGLRPTGPIEVRATPLLSAIESGRVCILKAPWNDALKNEINTFPSGDHDDIIAALSLGVDRLTTGKSKGVVWGMGSKGFQPSQRKIVTPKSSGIVTGATW